MGNIIHGDCSSAYWMSTFFATRFVFVCMSGCRETLRGQDMMQADHQARAAVWKNQTFLVAMIARSKSERGKRRYDVTSHITRSSADALLVERRRG